MLDINTERGQVTLSDERMVAQWFNSKPYHKYAETPKGLPAKIDAVLLKHNEIIGVAETKCRYGITLQQFEERFNNEWLLTKEKVDSALKIAEALCVPLFGFLYLVDDDTLLVRNLSKAKWRVETTKTQRSVNGGEAIRENVFINMTNAEIFNGIRTDW